MEREGDEVHIETDEARGGSTTDIMRYVLIISLVLAIGALSLIWMTGAAISDASSKLDGGRNGQVSGQAAPAPK